MLILISFFKCNLLLVNNEEKELYSINDFVEIFSSRNMVKMLNNSEVPWIVLFYAHYCGHCVRFAPIFKEFAREVSLRPIKIGVINCAAKKNDDECFRFNIKRYPTIVSFEKKFLLNEKNLTSLNIFTENKTFTNLVKLSTDMIFHNNTKNSPKELTRNDLTDFYDESIGEKVMLVAFEDKNSDMARNLALDTLHCLRIYTSKITDQESYFYNYFNLTNKTTPFVVATRIKNDVLLLGAKNQTDINSIRISLYKSFAYICPDLAGLFLLAKNKRLHNRKMKEPEENIVPEIITELEIDDLIGAISVSLRFEVAGVDMDNESKEVAKKWISMVFRCVPWPKEQKEALQFLYYELGNRTGGINRDDFKALLMTKQLTDNLPIDPKWKHCKGSEMKYRKFPCSLWLMLHTMVVNCENPIPGETDDIGAIQVLQITREYVDKFFTCLHCRDHFLDMSKNIAENVKTNKEALLWLWYSHNRVNARLRYDDTADPKAPKIQFPPSQICHECRNIEGLSSDDILLTLPGMGVENQTWNKPAIYRFIQRHYSAGNIRIKEENKDKINDKNLNLDEEYASIFAIRN